MGRVLPSLVNEQLRRAVEAVSRGEMTAPDAVHAFPRVKKRTLERKLADFKRLSMSGSNSGGVIPAAPTPSLMKRGRKPILSLETEEQIRTFTEFTVRSGRVMTRRMFCAIATVYEALSEGRDLRSLIRKDGSVKLLGRKWYRLYVSRESMSVRRPDKLDSERTTAEDSATISSFYKSLSEVIQRGGYGDTPFGVWNADETGFEVSDRLSHIKVVCPREARRVPVKLSADTARVSLLFAVSAAGSRSPPWFFYRGTKPRKSEAVAEHLLPSKKFADEVVKASMEVKRVGQASLLPLAGSTDGRLETGWRRSVNFSTRQ